MKQKVYDAIKLQSGKINFKNLHKKFDIDNESLHGILLELKLEGKIFQNGNKYELFPNDNFIGSISVTSTGKKFIFYNGKRVNLSFDYNDKVILNDIVSFKTNDNDEAIITSIIDRTLGNMTCEVVNEDGKKKIVPYHSEIKINLSSEYTDDLLDGDIILVNVMPNEVGEYANAMFVKKLNINKNDPNKREILTAINYGFDNDYSDEYLEELKSYPTKVCEEEIGTRRDFRNQKSFTIDGINTKDMDDGIYGERLENGCIRVYVHISDVSHYVKPDSLAFKRACEKTTSAYLGDSVFHMLHHIISNGICSLNPYEDRLTKTVIMDIDEYGNIGNFEIVKSVINSKKKMNYDDVDKVLLNEEIPLGYEEFTNSLYTLYEASLRLENKFLNVDGKLEFANDEFDNNYHSDGSIKEIKYMVDGPGRKLIENLMIAANKTVATWMYWSSIPSVYRIHEIPDLDKVNEAIEIINMSGFKMKFVNNVSNPKVIQKIIQKISSTDEFPILSSILIRFMKRARYSTENIGHYALGADAYTHFTSPIRRLPDLLVHMIIDLVLENPDKIDLIDFAKMEEDLKVLCDRSSKMERLADAASKDMETTLVIEKMAKSEQDVFEANVCDVDKKIRIKINGIECYIDRSNLENNFVFDTKKKLFYDSDNGCYIKVGAKLLVKLNRVNLANRSMNIMVLGIDNKKVKKRVLTNN